MAVPVSHGRCIIASPAALPSEGAISQRPGQLMAGRRSQPEKPATTPRGRGTIIAFHNGKPLGMKEVCPVSHERVHRDEETPKGKAGFAMKSSKGAWVGLLVLGVLVCPYALGYAAEDTQAESSFLAFQKTWIQKLNKEGRYGEKSMRVDRSAEDRSLFVARYDVVKEPGACRIKKTGQTACPYVGVMRYEVWTCTAKGKTQDEAKRGPFDCQPQSEITEIFRYAGGMWVY